MVTAQKEIQEEEIILGSVAGKNLKIPDVLSWEQGRFKDFFLFADFFYDNGKLTVTKERIESCEQYEESSPMIAEILSRINRPTHSEYSKTDVKSFFMRLNINLRIVKMAIEKKPELLLPSVVNEQRKKTQFHWMNKIYGQDGSVEFVFAKTQDVDKDGHTAVSIVPQVSPSSVLLNAMGQVADVYNKIAESITDKDIKTLSVKDKINALQKLSYIHTTAKKFKPNMNFIKINTNSNDRESLEAALLNFDDDENGGDGEMNEN